MKRVGSKQVGFDDCFALDGFVKLLEETIERGGRRDVNRATSRSILLATCVW